MQLLLLGELYDDRCLEKKQLSDPQNINLSPKSEPLLPSLDPLTSVQCEDEKCMSKVPPLARGFDRMVQCRCSRCQRRDRPLSLNQANYIVDSY